MVPINPLQVALFGECLEVVSSCERTFFELFKDAFLVFTRQKHDLKFRCHLSQVSELWECEVRCFQQGHLQLCLRLSHQGWCRPEFSSRSSYWEMQSDAQHHYKNITEKQRVMRAFRSLVRRKNKVRTISIFHRRTEKAFCEWFSVHRLWRHAD